MVNVRFHWTLRWPDGTVEELDNLVTDAGLNWIANGYGNLWLAVGTSNTPASGGQTTLGAELVRGAGSLVIGTAKRTYSATLTLGATNTVREIGSFTASVGGTMVSRSVIADRLIPANDLDIDLAMEILFAATAP